LFRADGPVTLLDVPDGGGSVSGSGERRTSSLVIGPQRLYNVVGAALVGFFGGLVLFASALSPASNISAGRRLLATALSAVCFLLVLRMLRSKVVVDGFGIRHHGILWTSSYPWSAVAALNIGGAHLEGMVCPHVIGYDLRTHGLTAAARRDNPTGRSEVEQIIADVLSVRERFES
jgi:hypothetical protein